MKISSCQNFIYERKFSRFDKTSDLELFSIQCINKMS